MLNQPTSYQQETMKQFRELFEQGLTQHEKDALKGMESMPIYDADARRRFQILLSTSISQVEHSLNTLAEQLQSYLPELPNDDGTMPEPAVITEENISAVEDICSELYRCLRFWNHFLKAFDSIIDLHLGWMARAFKLSGTTHKGVHRQTLGPFP